MKNKVILYVGNDLSRKSNYNTTMNTLSNLLNLEGCEVIRTSSKKNKLARIVDMSISVFKYSKKANYVLIDTFSTKNFYYALVISQLCRLLRKKYIPILHGGNLPQRLKQNPFLCRLIFKYSHNNVAPSMYLKTHFDSAGFVTEYIPNTIEIDEYRYTKRNTLSPKLLWVRAFDTTYNPQLAIKVINQMMKRFPEAKLCMVGPVKDASFDACKKLVSDLDLTTSVTFTGVLQKEEWHQLSENYDIFINTTNVDNTPVSVIEAMALGLPIVSTNVGGIPYLLKNGEEAILVERDNPEAMVKAIFDILDSEELNYTQKARKKAESFDWSVVKTKWDRLLS